MHLLGFAGVYSSGAQGFRVWFFLGFGLFRAPPVEVY